MLIATLCCVMAALAMIRGVDSYSSGASSDACYSLLPGHYQNDQTLIPPINCSTGAGAGQCNGLSLTITRNGISDGHYSCDAEHQVTLTSEREFVGYLIQARVPLAGLPFHKYRIVGTMISVGPLGRVLYCNATDDSPSDDSQPNSATQNVTVPVHTVTITWRAPQPFIAQGNIQFYATVVENFNYYYLPVTSGILEPLSSTCESYLPFLSLGTTAGVETLEIARLDDWASDPIPIPNGLPFATYNHTVVYIGTNGVFSFGYRETGYWHHISDPTRFYAAPFWGDVNIEDGGDIVYEIHTAPSLLIDQVSSLVSVHTGVPFSATWMVVAFWASVQQYGNPTTNGNTFQGIVLTDGVSSFMVSTFRHQSISWYTTEVRIGYMGDLSHFLFGPLNNSTFLGLFNSGSVMYYNEVYQLSIDGARLTLVQPALNEVTINIRADITIIRLQFDLAVDAASCDTTQFLLQTLNKAVTFIALYKAECEAVTDYQYSEDSEDSVITFALHPSDHIRFHNMPYDQIAASDLAAVSIGSTFVRTTGHTEVTPVYFTDMLTANVNREIYTQVTVLAFYLDMIRAEFN